MQPSNVALEAVGWKNGTFIFQGICTWHIWQSWSVFMARNGSVVIIFIFLLLGIVNPVELCETKLKLDLVNASRVEGKS